MNKSQFEAYLKAVSQQIKADQPDRPAFDKGYALGKIVGQLLRDFTDLQAHEFYEGMQLGTTIEGSKTHKVH
jgi:hypothetical protein